MPVPLFVYRKPLASDGVDCGDKSLKSGRIDIVKKMGLCYN